MEYLRKGDYTKKKKKKKKTLKNTYILKKSNPPFISIYI